MDKEQAFQAAMECVHLVVERWYVDELYHQCVYCERIEPGNPEDEVHHHKEDCPVLKAYKLLTDLEQKGS